MSNPFTLVVIPSIHSKDASENAITHITDTHEDNLWDPIYRAVIESLKTHGEIHVFRRNTETMKNQLVHTVEAGALLEITPQNAVISIMSVIQN